MLILEYTNEGTRQRMIVCKKRSLGLIRVEQRTANGCSSARLERNEMMIRIAGPLRTAEPGPVKPYKVVSITALAGGRRSLTRTWRQVIRSKTSERLTEKCSLA
jgi:hypothetical protein